MRTTRLLLMILAVFTLMLTQESTASAPADTLALLEEDSINARSLIISEVQFARGEGSWSYVEFYNSGSTTLDMTRFLAFGRGNWNASWTIDGYETTGKRRLIGTLDPGKTYLLIQWYGNGARDPLNNPIYPNGYMNVEAAGIAEYQGVWSSDAPDMQFIQVLDKKIGILYKNQITAYQDSIYPDSVFIDRFGIDGADESNNPGINFTIAGVNADEPFSAKVYVRKYSVTKGNTIDGAPVNTYPITQWNLSRGTDITDSEWIPLPKNQVSEYDKIFTTVDYHGPQPDLTLSSDIATIDVDGQKVTMPKYISRDSVFRIFETGPNHAWDLKLGMDTGQFFIQEDDSLIFYTVGNTLETYKFGVVLTGDDNKSAVVAPLVYKNTSGVFTKRYDISNGVAPMDTIGTLPYDTPVDTFFKYMVKPEGSAWKIVPADGTNRPEVKNGDKLMVTSKDESTVKEYHLGVMGFYPNHNASIETVYLPGSQLWENPETFMLTDTMLDFNSNSYFYSIDLPLGTKVSPAIIATAGDHRATVLVKRAKDLNGTEEEKTATIIVTAEDDTTVLEYKILFNVERETPPVKGSLFITDIGRAWAGYNQSTNISFLNPSAENVDLSDYALVGFPTMNWQAVLDAYANDSNWVDNNKYVFRFGSIVEPSEDMTPVFKPDLSQRTILLPSNEQYNISSGNGWPLNNSASSKPERQLLCPFIDFVMHDAKSPDADYKDFYGPTFVGSSDPYGTGLLPWSGYKADLANWGVGLARILNDSIKDGTKHVMGDFENDYEWVDLVGGPNYDYANGKLYHNDTTITIPGNAKNAIYRKPHVYKGNPVEAMSFGTGVEETKKTIYPSEWEIFGWDHPYGARNSTPSYNDIAQGRFNNHIMLTYAHISYLTSSTYIMEEGLVGPQQVYGVTAGTTVDQFIANVYKADTGMVIKVLASDGTVLTGDAQITAGTHVWSKSASGNDSVDYVISALAALSNNCTITSDKYTISVNGATGKISGIAMGTTLEDMLKDLTEPDHSTMILTNGGEEIVPLMHFNRDTIDIKAGTMVKTLVSTKAFVEVTAQDKVSKCIYALEFSAEDDPYVLSDIYVIDQTEKVINFAGRTTPNKFKSNLIPSPGASIKVVNKYDQERVDGTMEYSDRLIVTLGDVSTEYWVKYTVLEDLVGVSVKDIENKGLSIYPNPTTDYITLHGFSGKYVEIRDLIGKLISIKQITTENPVVDMRSMSSGVYILTTENNSFKVIKE